MKACVWKWDFSFDSKEFTEMLVFLRSAGKLFQACGAACEIRLFPYVVVLTFGTTNVLFADDRRLRFCVYGCNFCVKYCGASPFKDLNTCK